MVPATVASAILGVVGLNDVAPTMRAQAEPIDPAQSAVSETADKSKPKPKPAPKPAGLPTVSTCSAYWGQKQVSGAPRGYTANTTFDQCSLAPSQLRKAYGVTASGLTGKGATVAIVDAYGSSTMLADANRFAVNHGDKAFRKGQYSEVITPKLWTQTGANDGCGGGPAGWAGEESLDVEMVHGLAPDANVVYVGANSCSDQDLMAALSTIVDKHLADVVSSSWSGLMHTTSGDESLTTIAAYEQIFEQGAAEGVGFDFSAGDCGNNSPAAAATGSNCDNNHRGADQLPGLGLLGHQRRRHRPRHQGRQRQLRLRDRHGHPALGAQRQRQVLDAAARRLLLRRRRWHQPGLRPAVVPGPGCAQQAGAHPDDRRGQQDRAAGHPRRRHERRPVHLGAGRHVRRQPVQRGRLRRHQRLGAGVLRHPGRRDPGPPRSFDRLRQPSIYERYGSADFHDVVNNTLGKGQQPLNAVADFGVISGSLRVRLVAFGRDYGLAATKGYDDATGVGTPDENYLLSFR
ncbi:hypothetical protein GXW82_18410 [Streptacidiphilus sp. 4-A2]|nr:hypothetical protein [Streptacidiphilus sp. 4-A2]